MKLNSNDNLWDFEIVAEELFKNINHIHPLKQNDILKIVKNTACMPDVEYIIVFGSSVRFDCNSLSDIDILVKSNRDSYEFSLPDDINSDVDVIHYWRADDRLLEEIANTGVLVYSKEELDCVQLNRLS